MADADAVFRVLSTATTPGPFVAFARALLDDGVVAVLAPLAEDMVARWPKNDRVVALHADVVARAARMRNTGAAALDVRRSQPRLRKAIADVRKSGDPLRMLLAAELAVRNYPDQSWALENILRVLNGASRFDEALHEFDAAPHSAQAPSDVVFQAYLAAVRGESPRRPALRDMAMAAVAGSPHADLWAGRIYRLENDIERALAAFVRAAEADPDDAVALREVASFGLALGRIGEYASYILKAEATAAPELRTAIAAARDLLTAAGGSLEQAAAGSEPSASIASPVTAFDLVCDGAPAAPYEPASALMMVGGSLAAGGAERILSTLFAAYRRMLGPDAVSLVLFDCVADAPTSFYLPQAEIAIPDILIARAGEVSDAKVGWLPRPMAIRAQGIHDHVRAARPAVVHASLDMANVCAAYAAILAGAPRIVLHVHNMRPTDLAVAGAYNPDFDRCYRALLRRPEVHLVAVSQATLDDYLDWMGLEHNRRTHVIHNGFDFTDFDQGGAHGEAVKLRQALGIAPDARLIGTAFRFAELKRPDWWVEIAALVAARHPDTHFILFGDGERLEETRALAARLGLTGRIHFPGRVTNLAELIGAFDLFMLTSRTEGLPNVLIEAQAAGVPVVSFDVGGARDTFADGVTGRLVREQSVAAMAEAVSSLLDSPEMLSAAGEAARTYVRERFPVARMVDDLAAVLDLPISIRGD